MGIDLAHVRYVIHWTLSKSIEGFYQESGRAGRDGLPSLSILYYSRDDASKFAFLIRKNLENKQRSAPDKSSSSRDTMDALDKMIEYCTSTCCRRKYLLRHFGEEIDPKKVCRMTCDYCLHPQKVSDAMMSTTQGTSNISRAIRDVKRQSFGYMSSFYDHSNGSDDEEYNHVDHDILFQEWGYGDEDPGGAVVPPASPIHHYQNNKNDHHKKTTGAHAGFSTAGGTQIYNSGRRRNTTTTTTNILSKYETMEQQQQQSQPNTKLPYKNNHDKHKSNLWSKVMNQQEDDIPCKHPQHYRQQRRQQQQTSSSTSHIPIPSHLLPKSPNVQKTNPPKHNPNNNYNSTINTATTPSSSKDFASAADAVKAELEEIRKKRESLLAKFSKK
jgi:superfamily II DNA/RNA helicase